MIRYPLHIAAEKSILYCISSSMAPEVAATGSLSSSYYSGQNNVEKDAPSIIVHCSRGTELYKDTRIYNIECNCLVNQMAVDVIIDDDGNMDSTLVEYVFNIFNTPNIKSQFTNTGSYGFACIDVMNVGIESEIDGDTIKNKITAEVIGCLS